MRRRTYTREEIEQKFDSLPEGVRKYIHSFEMDVAVQKIAQKNNLHIDQMGLLEAEIVDVVLGKTEPENFVPYMMETLEIDQEQANNIAQAVNVELFEKIRAYMRGEITPPTQVVQPQPVQMYVPPPLTSVVHPAPQTILPTQPTPAHTAPMATALVTPITTPAAPTTPIQATQPPLSALPKTIVGFDKVSPTASVPVPPVTHTTNTPTLTTQPTTQQAVLVQPAVTAASAALQQPTVTPVAAMPPTATDPNKPTKQYSTDPYHEPLE